MNIEQFIQVNIKKKLIEKGVSEKIAHRLAIEAKSKYSALGNQGGKMFDNLLKEAEKQAKFLKKIESN